MLHVLGIGYKTPRGGECTSIYPVAIGANILLILDEQSGQHADRTRPKAQQRIVAVFGESLKIAPYLPGFRGDGQRIFRESEMVEADRRIARFNKHIET